MRKVIAILLIAVSVFLFAGCGDNKSNNEPKSYPAKYIAYVNYFGEVKKYEVATYMDDTSKDRIRLKLTDGSHIIVDNNNVILEEK